MKHVKPENVALLPKQYAATPGAWDPRSNRRGLKWSLGTKGL